MRNSNESYRSNPYYLRTINTSLIFEMRCVYYTSREARALNWRENLSGGYYVKIQLADYCEYKDCVGKIIPHYSRRPNTSIRAIVLPATHFNHKEFERLCSRLADVLARYSATKAGTDDLFFCVAELIATAEVNNRVKALRVAV